MVSTALPMKLSTSINEFKETKSNNTTFISSHTFVRVYSEGIWWIYEYNEDGELINIYPDEE